MAVLPSLLVQPPTVTLRRKCRRAGLRLSRTFSAVVAAGTCPLGKRIVRPPSLGRQMGVMPRARKARPPTLRPPSRLFAVSMPSLFLPRRRPFCRPAPTARRTPVPITRRQIATRAVFPTLISVRTFSVTHIKHKKCPAGTTRDIVLTAFYCHSLIYLRYRLERLIHVTAPLESKLHAGKLFYLRDQDTVERMELKRP